MFSSHAPLGPGGLPHGFLTPLLHDIVQFFLTIEFLGVLLTPVTVKTFMLILDSIIILYIIYKTRQSYVSDVCEGCARWDAQRKKRRTIKRSKQRQGFRYTAFSWR